MLEFMRRCSRWSVCSVNRCPLDVDMHLRRSASGDPERTCKAHPRERMEIAQAAAQVGVQISGLTDDERESIESGATTLEALYAGADARAESRKEHALKMLRSRKP